MRKSYDLAKCNCMACTLKTSFPCFFYFVQGAKLCVCLSLFLQLLYTSGISSRTKCVYLPIDMASRSWVIISNGDVLKCLMHEGLYKCMKDGISACFSGASLTRPASLSNEHCI